MTNPDLQETIEKSVWAFDYAREMAVGSFDGDDYRLAEALANAITLLKAQHAENIRLNGKLVQAWRVLDDSEPNHPVTQKIYECLVPAPPKTGDENE